LVNGVAVSIRRSCILLTVSTSDQTRRRPITESPWYWVYLFCTAGLVALVLAGPKFAARQSQIERKYESRQRAAQHAAGREIPGSTAQEQRTGTRIGLAPLYIMLGTILSIAWCVLWWRHYLRAPRSAEPASLEKVTE
jgi:hypothetical protein